MKHKVLIIVAVSAFSVACISAIAVTASNKAMPEWFIEHKGYIQLHDSMVASNIAKLKNYSRPQITSSQLHEMETMSKPAFTNIDVIKPASNLQLSPNIMQHCLFTNYVFTPYDMIAAGVSKDNSKNGLIFDESVQPPAYGGQYIGAGTNNSGTLTISKVEKNLVYMKGADGSTVIYNVTTHAIQK